MLTDLVLEDRPMTEKEAYQKKLEAQLDLLLAEVHLLKAKADNKAADAGIDMHKEVEVAKAEIDAARDKLKEFKDTGDDAWEDVKHGLEKAMASLASSLESAKSRFL